MKPRLLLFLACLALWVGIYCAFLSPANTLLRQSAAVATAQNSNAAYITQQAVESGSNLPWLFGGFVILAIAFWVPFRSRSNSNTSS